MCVREGEIIYIPLPLRLIFGGMSPPLILINMSSIEEKLSISSKEMEKLSSLSRELNDLVEKNYQVIIQSLALLSQGFPEEIDFYPGRVEIRLEDVEFHICKSEEEAPEVVDVEVLVSVPHGTDIVGKQVLTRRALGYVYDILSWNAKNK